MQGVQLILPAVATGALGTALLMPLRDERRGRRATLTAGARPLSVAFRAATFPEQPPLDASTPQVTPTAAELLSSADQAEPRAASSKLSSVLASFLSTLRRALAPPRPADASGVETLEANVDDESVVAERSFADELALLLHVGGIDDSSQPVMHTYPDSVSLLGGDAYTRHTDTTNSGDDADDEHAIVIPPVGPARERGVPLTRLPLRPLTASITWPELLDPAERPHDRTARHTLLESCARRIKVVSDAALCAAYRQEDALGRLLALQAIRSSSAPVAHTIFSEALSCGTDDERVCAIDALAALGDRETLSKALSDRVDAVAARAALAIVGQGTREDYYAALVPFVDEARVNTILGLLAGIIS